MCFITESSVLEGHRDYNQVVMDVNRTLKRFPPGKIYYLTFCMCQQIWFWKGLDMPQYSWNNGGYLLKHQSINQSIMKRVRSNLLSLGDCEKMKITTKSWEKKVYALSNLLMIIRPIHKQISYWFQEICRIPYFLCSIKLLQLHNFHNALYIVSFFLNIWNLY